MQSGKIGGAEASAPVSTLSQIAHRHTHALNTHRREETSQREGVDKVGKVERDLEAL